MWNPVFDPMSSPSVSQVTPQIYKNMKVLRFVHNSLIAPPKQHELLLGNGSKEATSSHRLELAHHFYQAAIIATR